MNLAKGGSRRMGSQTGLGLLQICVFIEEAGFNQHTQGNHGRSRKGSPTKGIVPTAIGVTITILGAISQTGIKDILRKPQAAATSKKRKVNGKAIGAVNGRIGCQNRPSFDVRIECNRCIRHKQHE